MIDPLEAANTQPVSPTPELSLFSKTRVPNEHPTIPAPYRLAIIGDAPGTDDTTYKRPFVGTSGKLLDAMLGMAGITRAACYIGNVCQVQPPKNDITEFDSYLTITKAGVEKSIRQKGSYISHEYVQEGLAILRADLAKFKPNCCLILGQAGLTAARGPGFPLDDWRGSILSTSMGKVVPTFHPYEVLRNYNTSWPFFNWDIQRARLESETPDLVLPKREFELDLSADAICHRLDTWPGGKLASVDIEGGLDVWSCISIADSPWSAFIVAFSSYSTESRGRVYASLSRFLYRQDIPKCLQNSLYDNFVLYYGYKMLIRNVVEDTMVKWRCLYSELPKGLDTQTSVLTREPAWKHLIAYSITEQKKRAKAGVDKATEIRNKYRACCIDSSVTIENCLVMDKMLTQQERQFYNFNMQLLPIFLSMEKRGFAYDKTGAASELAVCKAGLSECATRLEQRVGYSLIAKISISQQKLKKCLYEEKGYPPQYSGRGLSKKLTSDKGALLNLGKTFPSDPLLADLLLYSKLDGIRETLEIETDPDGRVRCSYDLTGTETFRLNCKTSPTGSGANLQTITKQLRRLYRADPGYFMFQCDLAGADGWTVAAHCRRHGDPTMWDDYIAGLKPAKIVALMWTYGLAHTQCSREELLDKCKIASAPGGCCDQDSWLYFGCKRVQHSTNYGTKAKSGVQQVMEDSYKMSGRPYYMSIADFEALQRLYLVRYSGLFSWHQWASNQVAAGHDLTSASGHTRKFFGRRKSWDYKSKSFEADQDTWREFLAEEPQGNTTYVTNCATLACWTDPENQWSERPLERRARPGNHIIEPLHSVHDAFIGQFPIESLDWALERIPLYFKNPITVAGYELTIPFEGAYGPSWGEQGVKYGGGEIRP